MMNGTNSLVNVLMASSPEALFVGMGGTILHWTDREAVTVVEIVGAKTIRVIVDKATRTDVNGMSEAQAYAYSPGSGAAQTFTLRANGEWVKQGDPMRDGTRLALGERRKYYDYSF